MADNEALIPYPHNREIILRQKDSVVVYDPASKSLVTRSPGSDLAHCPYCRQPLPGDAQHGSPSSPTEAVSPTAATYASPEYFRMLQRSLPGLEQIPDSDQPPTTALPPSPRRRLTNAFTDEAQQSSSTYPGFDSSAQGISAAAFSPNYFNRFFQEERVLGKGGKGVVLLVKHVLDGVSLGHFALKRIPVGDDHEWLEKVLVEVQLLQHLSHQNLVSYRHVWLEDVQITKFGPSVPCAFVLQQYCNAGDLQQYILQGATEAFQTREQLKQRMRRRSRTGEDFAGEQDGPRRLQFEEVRAFFKDITAGLSHLHDNNYIHRDLKPSNCLLHRTKDTIRVLVSDFGEVQTESQVRQSSGATGTISYCAPEVLRANPETGGFGNFTTKSDVFSLGLILYFLCFARLPYQNADQLNEDNEDVDLLRQEILDWAGVDSNSSGRADLPEKLHRFLARLLALDPAERPTAEEALHYIKTGTGIEYPADTQQAELPRRRSKFSPTDSSYSMGQSQRTTRSMSRRFSSSHRTASPPSGLELSPKRRSSSEENAIASDGNSDTGDEYGVSTSIPNSSLVIRSRHSSPVKTSHFPRALPAPPVTHFYDAVEFLYSVKIVCMAMKILSIYILCQPLTARADAGIILLGLTILDLLLPASHYITLALFALHFGLLWAMARNDVLCLPRDAMWHIIHHDDQA